MLNRNRRLAIVLAAAIAFAVKVLLALRTYGTNDVYTYERFGLWSRYFGVDLYNIAPDLNHPPSMLHILSGLLWISDHTPLPFHFWLRFAGIVADAGTLWLIWQVVRERIGERPVFIALLLIALSPINILISGFHGNTDPVMIFFVLLAVWLAGYRGYAATGGLAYGAALCIKIAPVILIPVLFLSLPGIKKRLAFFLGATTVVAVGWAPYFYQQPSAVFHQVFGYKGSYGLWGFSWLARKLANAWPAAAWVNKAFSIRGNILVVVAILAVSVLMHRMVRKPSLYAQIGMVYLLFFTATTGFAVQYLAWLTPWIATAELGAIPAACFMLTGSVFLLVVYNYWNLGMPWDMAIAYPWEAHHYFQVLCWASVVFMLFAAWHRMREGEGLNFAVFGRVSPPLRFLCAAVPIGAFLAYPAVKHMRQDWFEVTPVYAEDDVLYTRADGLHNLASLLASRGRAAEADAVENQVTRMVTQGQRISDALSRLQRGRLALRTPEDYVDASRDDYNRGDYAQCVDDARESLKSRPFMPAALYNISLCSAELADWDSAIAAAAEEFRVEPESDDARANLQWALGEKRRLALGKQAPGR